MGNKAIDCKLIALDLDGTTLKEGGWLSDTAREAIIAAIAAGYIVVPTTGRALSEIPDEIMSISGIRHVIVANGASVIDLSNGEEIFSDLITLDTTNKIVEHLYSHDLFFQVYSEGASYCDERFMQDVIRFFGDSDANYAWLAQRMRFIQNLPAYFEKGGRQTEKITVNLLTGEKRTIIEKVLEEIPSVAATSSDPINMEINSVTANKGAALLQLSTILGISREHILAIGDGDNDIEMLSFAGFSVAMANASDGAKRAASYVTVSNNEDGVPVVFRKFLGIE